jgi:hypothetical protein
MWLVFNEIEGNKVVSNKIATNAIGKYVCFNDAHHFTSYLITRRILVFSALYYSRLGV